MMSNVQCLAINYAPTRSVVSHPAVGTSFLIIASDIRRVGVDSRGNPSYAGIVAVSRSMSQFFQPFRYVDVNMTY
jgi:hypothetical protein